MKYSIAPVEEADIPRVTDLICDGTIQHGISEYAHATWPGMETAEGRADARSRFLLMHKHLKDPTSFLKVVNPDDGSIVACSLCAYNSEPPSSLSGLSGDGWETADERTYADHIRAERNGLLLRIYARLQGPVTEVYAFFVDTSLQRRGIGTFLMQHLIHLDRQRGVPLVLIANPRAQFFYRKNGFQVEEDAVLPLPEQWSAKPPSNLISMIYRD